MIRAASADDIATVMDAVGLPRAQIMGSGATAPGAVVFAAAHPDRVDGLVANRVSHKLRQEEIDDFVGRIGERIDAG